MASSRGAAMAIAAVPFHGLDEQGDPTALQLEPASLVTASADIIPEAVARVAATATQPGAGPRAKADSA